MAVVMVLELPGATSEQYDEINKIMGINGPEDEPPGLVSHVCAKTAEGLVVIDVWRSQEELEDFTSNRVGPAAGQVGVVPSAPKFGELYYHFNR